MSLPYRGIPGIEAWEIDPTAGELRIGVSPQSPPPPTEAVREQWTALLRSNSRYHDSPILSVLTFDPHTNEILTRVDGYMRLAVQPRVNTGVRLLGVTALLCARDRAGREFVLLGRRAPGTRVFGGMWELGPSGGVAPPTANIAQLDCDYLTRQLADEISEEVGMMITHAATPVAYIRDHGAHSDDVVLRFTLGFIEDLRHQPTAANWEYTEVVWMPTDSAHAWDHEGVIDATRATFRVMGWIDPA
ncbi:MAG: hypothetical protein JSR77_12590 [Planctomycetes bacterium]|nr:hypothetical protein [Planctomycetota bacterium]